MTLLSNLSLYKEGIPIGWSQVKTGIFVYDYLNAEPNPYLARKKDMLAFFLQLSSQLCNWLQLDLSCLLFSEKMQIIIA
jgi:hypothetical protein